MLFSETSHNQKDKRVKGQNTSHIKQRAGHPILRVLNLTDILDCYETNRRRIEQKAYTENQALITDYLRQREPLMELDLNQQGLGRPASLFN